jgi:hypothetical protein
MPYINRYSCKCRCCKAKWMTSAATLEDSFKAHLMTCEKAKLWCERRRYVPSKPNDMYNIAASLCERDQVKGTLKPSHKCDSRCTGATGKNCECSCGGANHGIDNMQ